MPRLEFCESTALGQCSGMQSDAAIAGVGDDGVVGLAKGDAGWAESRCDRPTELLERGRTVVARAAKLGQAGALKLDRGCRKGASKDFDGYGTEMERLELLPVPRDELLWGDNHGTAS